MGLRVLVIEDDAALNEIVCTFLTQEGYACTPAFSGSEARMLLERCDAARGDGACEGSVDAGISRAAAERGGAAPAEAQASAFDLVVTDLMLPGCPGEELVPLVRQRLGNVPVIVTSAKGAVTDRVALLRTGADDYLVKPFDLDELLARIEAQVRVRAISRGQGAGRLDGAVDARSAVGAGIAASEQGVAVPTQEASAVARGAATDVFRFGAWELDLGARTFSAAGVPVKLTRMEFDVLAALMARPDKVFTKRELYRAACHDEAYRADLAAGAGAVTAADERALVTHVGNLRAKLKETGTDGYLETVWGIGFKLRADADRG